MMPGTGTGGSMPSTTENQARYPQSRRSQHPLLLRLVCFVILPAIAVLGLELAHLSASLPQESGRIQVSGVKADTTLARDSHGVVHISAKTDEDAFFALGYAHAQDRLWQLEVQRRTAQGRLSEIFGQQSIKDDIWFRTLGLYAGATESWQALSPEAQASLTAYARGINAYISNARVLPIEFVLLDVRPQLWRVEDSLAWMKLFGLALSGNFSQKISRFLATQALSERQLSSLFDPYPQDGPITTGQVVPDVPKSILRSVNSQRDGLLSMLRQQRLVEADLMLGGPFVGSNAWVVGPRHTKNGQTLLANDPHLGLQLPSVWYAAHLCGNKLDSEGMTLVGLPLVLLGSNQHIAWGATAMMADTQDLYFEQIDTDNPSSYRAGDHWAPFVTRIEKIEVRAAFPSFLRKPLKPITIVVRTTRHGPVISDMFKVFVQPVSLQWSGLSGQDTSYEGFFKLNYARNWAEFKTALSYQVEPAMNMFYSDRTGNIGYLGAGHIPRRRKGRGTYPVPGWDDSYGWDGFIPADAMPQSFNPEEGYIVNANNRVVGDDYPYFISQDWAPASRALRIRQLLNQKIGRSHSALTLEDMQEIQADTLSLPAAKMVPLLQRLRPADERQRQALNFLRHWNGDMRRDSQAAALFNVWMGFLRHALYDDKLIVRWGKTDEAAVLQDLIEGVSVDTLYRAVTAEPNLWCSDGTATRVETCDALLSKSLTEAIKRLSKLIGIDMSQWRWGAVQIAEFTHQPFSRVKVLDTLFGRKLPAGGSPDTIDVAYSSYSPAVGYLQHWGAACRQIIAQQPQHTTHWVMNSTGQSGNFLSGHYDDMLTPFGNVHSFAIDQASPAWRRLVLQPLLPQGQGAR